jgi:hypothetical protein
LMIWCRKKGNSSTSGNAARIADAMSVRTTGHFLLKVAG